MTLGGCTLDPPVPAPVRAPPDPDLTVAEAARAELSGLVERLRGTRGAGYLVRVHLAQLAALGGTAPSATGHPLTPAEVVARERRAADRCRHWATTCQGGDLARVLAVVAAGIAMQSPFQDRS